MGLRRPRELPQNVERSGGWGTRSGTPAGNGTRLRPAAVPGDGVVGEHCAGQFRARGEIMLRCSYPVLDRSSTVPGGDKQAAIADGGESDAGARDVASPGHDGREVARRQVDRTAGRAQVRHVLPRHRQRAVEQWMGRIKGLLDAGGSRSEGERRASAPVHRGLEEVDGGGRRIRRIDPDQRAPQRSALEAVGQCRLIRTREAHVVPRDVDDVELVESAGVGGGERDFPVCGNSLGQR